MRLYAATVGVVGIGTRLFVIAALPVFHGTAMATDVGVGRRAAGIAEIEALSAVAGSSEVRSLASQEGESGRIEIRNADTQRVLGRGTADHDGQYAIRVRTLKAGQIIQAVNTRTKFASPGVKVAADAPPAIDEPLAAGATIVRGRGTPGHRVEIVDPVTSATMGASGGSLPGNGAFEIAVPALLLFHFIQAVDVSTAPRLESKPVAVLDLVPVGADPPTSCQMTRGGLVSRAFQGTTFRCALPRPRGITFDAGGMALVVSGAPPSDLVVVPPIGVYRLSPSDGALALLSPVTGVAAKMGPGGSFGSSLFVARPRLFNVREKVLLDRGDGEIFTVNPVSREVEVYRRLLDLGPSGLAFDTGPRQAFGGDMIVSSFLGDTVARISAGKTLSTVVSGPEVRGIQGVAIGPGGFFGGDLYAAQPGSGAILRITPGGRVTPFVTGLVSPVDLAFGPGGAFGADLYVTDAASGEVVRVDASGRSTTLVGGLQAPFGLAFGSTGPALWVTEYRSGNVVRIAPLTRRPRPTPRPRSPVNRPDSRHS